MADVVNVTSKDSDDGNRKGEIASATNKVVDLLDDDDDDDGKRSTIGIMKEAYCILPQREDFCSINKFELFIKGCHRVMAVRPVLCSTPPRPVTPREMLMSDFYVDIYSAYKTSHGG